MKPRPDTNGSGGGSLHSTATSPSLLERVRGDDAAAWDRLVKLYAPLVYCWCRRWNLQEQDTADVFQEVFLAVAKHIAAFRKDGQGGTFRGWLRTITRNKVLDHFRRQGKQPGAAAGGSEAHFQLNQLPAPDGSEDASAAESRAEQGLFQRGLEFIKGEFEERTWQAFWRTTVEGRPPKDVADELGMSAGAVRVAKFRVLHRLREELGDLLE
ncbi:MAG: sigma-70 family RNA polymerase sigma factor [Planctomycetia bacterium]|nr:sigma-70 family RNA polymerase sigma factor [Planctomycetia bacterium]